MAKAPNIIFVFSDQQRWDTVGAYGGPIGVTPNLDRIAAGGVLFRNAFTCQPVCGPARAALQSGRYPAEVGCWTNRRRLPPEEARLAPGLGAAGYQTAYIGKWHLASCGERGGPDDYRVRPVPPELRGGYTDYWLAADGLEHTSHSYDGYMFDADGHRREFPEGRYRADVLTDWAIEYLRGRDSERPFFLFLSYVEPHHQNDHRHFEGPRGSKSRFGDYPVPGDLAGFDGDWQEELPDYLGCCAALDAGVARIERALEELGIAEETLLIYTSDHGCHFRTRNREYKRSPHDSCLRVPMIARGPGFRGGLVVDELVGLIDIPPTLLAAGGADLPTALRGRPMQALVDGTADDWPEDVFAQISESQVGRCIRTHRWKYSVQAPDRDPRADAGSDVYVEYCLYDLEADPNERRNLVRESGLADIRVELAATLKRRMVQAGETEPEIWPAQ